MRVGMSLFALPFHLFLVYLIVKRPFLHFYNCSLPLKRTGQPEDMGEAIYYLLTAKFCTGVILDVDGGHGIRQYANPTSDPMRQSAPQK